MQTPENTQTKGLAALTTNPETNTPNFTNNTAHNQRLRLLDYLKTHGAITTLQARHELDILCPAARIFELRHNHGYNIIKVNVEDYTEAKRKHAGIAKYVLVSEVQHAE